jgi:hypothetical protein
MSDGWGIIGPMTVDTVFIVENGPGSGQSGRWAHVYLSMAKAKAGVAHWAAKARARQAALAGQHVYPDRHQRQR